MSFGKEKLSRLVGINQNTIIADIIKECPESIEALASVARPLSRLRNPVLRKILSPRVTLGEAAKMSGTAIEDLAKALEPLGFQYQEIDQQIHKTSQKPEWLKSASEADITMLDVRPIIENGTDPLKVILQSFKDVSPGKILCVLNTFVPSPLIHLLEQNKASHSFMEEKGAEEIYTYFLKANSETNDYYATSDKLHMVDAKGFAEVCGRFTLDETKEIDVRKLEMPGPMQTILAELENLPKHRALYVLHKRVPLYLLEELADKDFNVFVHNISEGQVKLLVCHHE